MIPYDKAPSIIAIIGAITMLSAVAGFIAGLLIGASL